MPAQTNQMSPSEQSRRPHNIILTCRESAELSGIDDVLSFDESGVVLQTSLGVLSVDGEGLHIRKLDTAGGEVIIEGHIRGLFYIDSDTKLKKKLK